MRKAIILIHGFMTNPADFEPIMEDLRGRYDYVRRFLLPGHGEKEDIRNFTMEATIEYVEHEFDKVAKKYDVIDVVGFSLGGALATYLSNIRKFNKLVLLAPANKYLSPLSGVRRLVDFAKKIKDGMDAEAVNLTKLEKKHFDILNTAVKETIQRDAKMFRFAVEELLHKYTFHSVTQFAKTIRECNKALTKIKNPTLIVWGYLDEVVPKAAAIYDFERCVHPNKQMVVLKNLGHMMFRSEDVSELKQTVLDFLGKE